MFHQDETQRKKQDSLEKLLFFGWPGNTLEVLNGKIPTLPHCLKKQEEINERWKMSQPTDLNLLNLTTTIHFVFYLCVLAYNEVDGCHLICK